jgi:K+-transporting ATPase ATPase C chain
MLREIRPALSLVIFFTIATGFFLPEVFTGVAQAIFPFQAGGSLIKQNGQVVGSAIIGQNFTGPTWFDARPSALTGTDAKGNSISTPYDDSESGASNLAPSSASLLSTVQARVAAWHKTYGPGPVPADAATSSGSGVDPDISLGIYRRRAWSLWSTAWPTSRRWASSARRTSMCSNSTWHSPG